MKYINLYYNDSIYSSVVLKKEYVDSCKSDVVIVFKNDIELFRFLFDKKQFYYLKKLDIFYVLNYEEIEDLKILVD